MPPQPMHPMHMHAHSQMYPRPNVYGMPPEGYGYNPYMQQGYMGMPPQSSPFGAPPPHMQGIQPPHMQPPPRQTGHPAPQHESQGSDQRSAQGGAPAQRSAPAQAVTAAQPSTVPAPSSPAPQQPKPRAQAAPPVKAATSVADVQKNMARLDVAPEKPVRTAPAKAPTPAPAVQTQPGLAQPSIQHASTQQRQKPTVPGAAPGRSVAHRDTSVPTSDYDFESASARFQKDRKAGDANTPARLDAVPAGEASGPFYSKKAGFFDNISSEVKERYERRAPEVQEAPVRGQFAADEKARNVQTFGENAGEFQGTNRRGNRRGRGRGRRPGRGGGARPEWADN